jgi:DNA-binding CsgD family transcriptional regulator
MTTVESVAVLVDLGRLADATAAAEEGVERARLAGNPRMLLWAQSALGMARLAAGDVSAALRHAEQAAEPGLRSDFHAAGQPGWCRGAALTAAGNADRAVPVLLEAFGGPELARVLPADRPAAAADLIEAQLAAGESAAAEATLARAHASAVRAGTAPAVAATGIAQAAILLALGRPTDAVDAAVAARDAATALPMLSARTLLAEGQARAAAEDRSGAVGALTAAEAAFDGFGALRGRDQAARELRRLGHRVLRPARTADGNPLTAREREIAELVAAGRTNREIAEQLVLSIRTIEAHLRNIYGKLDVRSRVELGHALTRARTASTPPDRADRAQ